MFVYLGTKFQGSSIILTCFKQGGGSNWVILPPFPKISHRSGLMEKNNFFQKYFKII